MKTVASLEVDEARILLERLRQAGVFADLRTTAEESGLETSDILVEDGDYDHACDLLDAWESERLLKTRKQAKQYCPKCRSLNLESVPHDKLGYIYRCKDCGCEIVPR